ncbi:Fe-S cluster assembly protein Cia2/MIP18(mitotic spindle-associated MMXD complex subunit) [Monocercomonoides exilis]|uniref:Fe-S cluster assembly protein Cia2/MIP18(mitotic spindle-associated MMXD complex subunit) n=1 Tax=Monocercomonoides exilis TaxID=2049356 RepID=UPI003559AE36|nr:Fe-S cluster assembly protein Cia2/MIP18(mitotic spindle-associated MMXD complex subunit) [Monocercomonoides exilis]|eukprot:MONOS_5835.1-p1 / transcript=MONOS_5835.1 / gene=MONOS_5835 / organism=Monocercomonoides_exilis_PA203 / gene_product=Fe-S cluster assembly protein Cia2/MIP18(mitotic spindle-associated MMXD complex subunit) / transcript_product=Fe-S cluster assembly protein Cia2/MIP18(mitotic spindle-associated MMXD complex subunit) / location=Mono_scaffold00175:54234-54905(-) / protein_length=140 / sequence_SO=supercontig / SO=protein_coding / is_pseudo=false
MLVDQISPEALYELTRNIIDPEYPQTLEELSIISPDSFHIDLKKRHVTVIFTPTVPHCSMCMLIGLSIITRLRTSLPKNMKIFIKLTPGTHEDEEGVNKQLCDKERVAAAMENPRLAAVVYKCIDGKAKQDSATSGKAT